MVDFDIEKTFGQLVPPCSIRACEDWPYRSSRAGKINKTSSTISSKPGCEDTVPSAGACSANL